MPQQELRNRTKKLRGGRVGVHVGQNKRLQRIDDNEAEVRKPKQLFLEVIEERRRASVLPSFSVSAGARRRHPAVAIRSGALGCAKAPRRGIDAVKAPVYRVETASAVTTAAVPSTAMPPPRIFAGLSKTGDAGGDL